MVLTEPLRVVEKTQDYNIEATLGGGGVSGQAGALRLGIARALAELEPELRAAGCAVHRIGGADVAVELDAKRAIRQGVELAAAI
jgi:ribosomal protein S9